ncbi:putative D,D-dipeptide transport ATP-binding protein DdpF [subsurface metagenome]
MAIATQPRLIVLDEPTTSLDAESSAELIDLFINLKQKLHNSYIFISHDLHAIGDICDMVAVMYLGRIVEMGPKEQISNQPRHPYTKALMSAMLSVTTKIEDIIMLEGEVPSPVHLPEGCYFYSRCKIRGKQCAKEYPGKTTFENGEYVYCFQYQK